MPSVSTKPAVPKFCRGRRSRSASRDPARPASSTPRSVSTSSTSITAPGFIRCNCRAGSAARRPAWSRKSAQGVTDLKPGDRICYGAAPIGSYAEARLIPADRLLKLPDGIDDKTAAAMMLKGLTTQYLIRQTYRVKAGDTILLHAAAGGVGLILGQWAKHLGATVIGTVGSDEKAKLAQAHGCAHTIVYTREDFVKRVEEITGGKKVPVVYDSVGKDTFLKSLDCLAPLGVAALFGQSSGAVEPLNLGLLAAKGSLYVTRPTLNTYAAKRENLVAMANELFEVVKSGAVKIEVHQTYPLKDAAKAHADLAARKTTGSTVLTV